MSFPEFKDLEQVTMYGQTRPYREGGMRIQREKLHGKWIIHNYGHGGAGVTLAPSSANEATNLAHDILTKNAKVGIIGSGVIGLLTAQFILDYEPSVQLTVYTERPAIFGNKKDNQLITSEGNSGLWLPIIYDQDDK